MQSDDFNLNPWISEEDSGTVSAVELPAQVECLLSADLQKLRFRDWQLAPVRGKMLLKDRTLHLIDLQAGFLEGQMRANGTYQYLFPKKPQIFFDLDISQFSIAAAFGNIAAVRRFMPLAENLQGRFSGKLRLNSNLDHQLQPLWEQFFSEGRLSISKANLHDAALFNQLAAILKIDQLHNPALNQLNPSYAIESGRFHLHPTSFKIQQCQFNLSGSSGLDRSLDYTLKMGVPAALLKQSSSALITRSIQQKLKQLPDNATIMLKAAIKGTYQAPQIKIFPADLLKSATRAFLQGALRSAEEPQKPVTQQAQEALEVHQKELEAQKKAVEGALKKKLKEFFPKQ